MVTEKNINLATPNWVGICFKDMHIGWTQREKINLAVTNNVEKFELSLSTFKIQHLLDAPSKLGVKINSSEYVLERGT